MKKKWYSIFELIKFPLILLIVGNFLTSLGNIDTEAVFLTNVINCAVYFGQIIKEMIPLAMIITYLGRRYEDQVIVIVSIVMYVLLNLITLFFGNASLPSYFYTHLFGLGFDVTTTSGIVTRYPLNMGIIAAGLIILATGFSYRLSRKRYNYGFLSFISNDAFFLILNTLLTIGIGVMVVRQYTYCANLVIKACKFISVNRSNPASLFIFGIMKKVLDVLGMGNIVEDAFFTGILGGSWINATGTTIIGDINIWTSQIANNSIATGIGKYETYSYIDNLFVVPSIVIACYWNVNNKIERNKNLGLAILMVLLSLLSGSSVPVDLMLLFISPCLLAIHVVLSGITSMLCGIMNLNLGYELQSTIGSATIGNIIDLIKYAKTTYLNSTVVKVIILGIISFVLYQLITWLYYKFLSYYFLDQQKGKEELKIVVRGLGGIQNIQMITSTLNELIVVLNDKEKLNVDLLLLSNSYKVIERYYGYVVSYGPGSKELCRLIKKEMANYEDVMKYHTEEA